MQREEIQKWQQPHVISVKQNNIIKIASTKILSE